ncbi:cytochrome P450 2F2 isoform X1 [Nothobranchius furzeri]|uniref:Cytochrome P450 2F2-like n=2 Tax=Nothobranchius furzeri TaxID=105023 RepID=A0A8C6M0H1_NOTFU|nr:transcript variant X1 [Nothobranchius furzeri]
MFVSIVLLCISICFILLLLKSRRPKNFPPGPPAWPVLGNLLYLISKDPLKNLEKLRQSYGNVYSLFLGSRPVVVINGLKMMKEAMVTKGPHFAGRPQDLLMNRLTQWKGVILADYNSAWREHRRFDLMTLKIFGLGKKSMEDQIHEELHHTIKILDQSAGKTLSPQVMFHNITSNVIFKFLFGTRYEYDDENKVRIQRLLRLTKVINKPWMMIYDFIPKVRSVMEPNKKVLKMIEAFQSFSVSRVNEHKKSRIPGEPRDFIDCYLEELDKKNDASSFSEEQLISQLFDLYLAGTDTTANTLRTAFLYLMNHPQIQERCQQEIDQVLEGKDRVTFEDRHNMPYMQAVIHEVQRVANTVPLSAFHCTTRDTELLGYSIPKGTMIIQNMMSVLKEEGQWKFPHDFNPENFLNEQGEFVKPEAFMPFSAGPRMCIGESLASMELFLIVVTLLRKYKFIWPQDAGEPDYTMVFAGSLTPKPYNMKIESRSPQ